MAELVLIFFGLIAFGEFTIKTHVIRAGKTIELIEAELQAQGKTCIVAGGMAHVYSRQFRDCGA